MNPYLLLIGIGLALAALVIFWRGAGRVNGHWRER